MSVPSVKNFVQNKKKDFQNKFFNGYATSMYV